MFYVSPNFKSKKDLKAAVAAKREVVVFAPGLGTPPKNGMCAVGGPHYPAPHKWYAQVMITNGLVTAVK